MLQNHTFRLHLNSLSIGSGLLSAPNEPSPNIIVMSVGFPLRQMSFGGAVMSFVALFVCAARRFVDGSVVGRCGVLPVEVGGRADRHAPKQGGRTGDGAAPK